MPESVLKAPAEQSRKLREELEKIVEDPQRRSARDKFAKYFDEHLLGQTSVPREDEA